MTDSLLKQAMALDNLEKARLISMLNESLLSNEQKAIESNWATESQKRYEDYKAGNHATVDYADIKRKGM
ncbi:MAG TPA: addiction module protein [Turneriella sp.]|nr:addiction module protein [Turneriella sp.]HMY11020.1 addiction module protein [Turneriella sp.]HNE20573.1 addiction module protein [Turneriella sp.]HNL55188.1 addiction module protein [Turneriella sp.]